MSTVLTTTTLGGAHAHAIADVTGLQAALDGKAAAVHSHVLLDTATATDTPLTIAFRDADGRCEFAGVDLSGVADVAEVNQASTYGLWNVPAGGYWAVLVPGANSLVLDAGNASAQSDFAWELASLAVVGALTAPTPAAATNNTTVATTAFVHTAIANLVDAAPGTLDSLNELAAAIGDDPNFAATVATSIGTKLAKASNLSDLTDASAARTNLGLGSAATQASTAFTPAAHASSTSNPHSTTAAQVGAYTTGQVDTALAAKAPLASPTFTGTVTMPAANFGNGLDATKFTLYDDGADTKYGAGVTAGAFQFFAASGDAIKFSTRAVGGAFTEHFRVGGVAPFGRLFGSAASGSVGTEQSFSFIRDTSPGVSYLQVVDFKVGRHTAPTGAAEPHTRLDIALKHDESLTVAGDVIAITLRSDKRVIQAAASSAAPDGDIPNNAITFYLDQTGHNLMVRVRYSDGTLKTGTVALA